MNDVTIVGGGISGLWTLNRLLALGYNAHLYEKTALGSGQTIASQGIIHGGIKYLGGGPKGLSDMPNRWRKCFNGSGEIYLNGVHLLSNKHQVRVRGIPLWSFNEPVVAVKSLIQHLSHCGNIHLGEPEPAKLTIHTAGIGNEGLGAPTQRRPLRMFMVREMPDKLFAHYMDDGSKPRVTITTHPGGIWYLGGRIAEITWLNHRESIEHAKHEMRRIMPRIDWDSKQWAVHDVHRAEPLNDGKLPSSPKVSIDGNRAVAWPTKLALAPILADMLVEWVQSMEGAGRCIFPGQPRPPIPPIARYPWEDAKWM